MLKTDNHDLPQLCTFNITAIRNEKLRTFSWIQTCHMFATCPLL